MAAVVLKGAGPYHARPDSGVLSKARRIAARVATPDATTVPGEVAEWSNAPDSKSGLRLCRNVGSNPTLSARNENAPRKGRFSFLAERVGGEADVFAEDAGSTDSSGTNPDSRRFVARVSEAHPGLASPESGAPGAAVGLTRATSAGFVVVGGPSYTCGIAAIAGSLMNTIAVPVSFGELIDKITILEIKAERIGDAAKVANVRTELDMLDATWAAHAASGTDIGDERARLRAVNEALWDIEDRIRMKEKAKAFDAEFIELARSVYVRNDERAAVKREINLKLGSTLVEEKSYQDYL